MCTNYIEINSINIETFYPYVVNWQLENPKNAGTNKKDFKVKYNQIKIKLPLSLLLKLANAMP